MRAAWTWFRPDGRLSAEEVGQVYAQNMLSGLLADPDGRRPAAVLPQAVIELRHAWSPGRA